MLYIGDLLLAIRSPKPEISIYAGIDALNLLRVSKDSDGQYYWQPSLDICGQSTFCVIQIFLCGEPGLRVRHTFGSTITLEFKIGDVT